jgi:hypothetical protein
MPNDIQILSVALLIAALVRWTDIAGANELADSARQSLRNMVRITSLNANRLYPARRVHGADGEVGKPD